jgi:hypothetical protein
MSATGTSLAGWAFRGVLGFLTGGDASLVPRNGLRVATIGSFCADSYRPVGCLELSIGTTMSQAGSVGLDGSDDDDIGLISTSVESSQS